jgi:type II secretory pathway component GspD/PulD (secretin)
MVYGDCAATTRLVLFSGVKAQEEFMVLFCSGFRPNPIRHLRHLRMVFLGGTAMAWLAASVSLGAEAAEAKPSAPTPATESAQPAVPGEKDMPASPAPADNRPPPPADAPAKRPALAGVPPIAKEASRLRFNFRFQPWREVLDWFAQQAGLSLVSDNVPPGTFNYTDDREYTPAEAIDLLNSVLLTKGYTLIRRGRMLMVINLEDGIPPNLVPTVAVDELDQRGEFELVSVLFNLERMSTDEAELELKKFVGPQGAVVAVPATRQVLVTETAGRLRAIRQVLDRIERPTGTAAGQVRIFDLRQSNPQSVLDVLRQLLDIPADRFATGDGSIHFTLDGSSQRLVVSGKPEKLSRVEEILQAIDVHEVTEPAAGRSNEATQLEVYPITAADADSVLRVIQTLLSGIPDVRLAIDPKTGSMIAMARPSQQAVIRATLDQLQRESRQVEVITLTRLDPQSAVASITKLFPADAGAAAPQIDADTTSRQLLIRATPAQLQQIRTLLEKMGEPSVDKNGMMATGNIRTVPLTGRGARSALEKIQDLWPTVRKNKIRVVSPSSAIPSVRAGQEGSAIEQLLELMQRGRPSRSDPATTPSEAPADKPKPAAPARDKSASAGKIPVRFASQTTAKPAEESSATGELAPIIVVPGPGGVVIASEDVEALNQFEQLFKTLASGLSTSGPEMTVFYLKYAKATVMAETLSQILSGASSSSDGGSGGGMPMGGPMGGPPGGPEAAMASALLNIGGSVTTSGNVKITADSRLNALVVQAVPADLDTIEQLLKVLDQKESPEEIPAAAKPRIIPVQNLPAASLADIIRQLYADRMITANTSVQSQFGGGPFGGPMGMAMMMAAGRSGSRRSGRGSQQEDETQKLSVGVDTRANSLIVLAPDPLFEEVRQLVEHLDADALKSNQRMEVVTLKRTNLTAVQQALTAMLGENAQTSSSATPSSGYSGSGRGMMQGGFGGFPMGGFGPPGGFGPGDMSSGGGFGSRRSRSSGESSGTPSSRSGGRGR